MRHSRASWIERTRQRRGPASAGAFTPGLLPERCLSPVAALHAAAETVVKLVAQCPVVVQHEPDASLCHPEDRIVNLDGRTLVGSPPNLASAERLIGLAAHEGAHVRMTEMLPRGANTLQRFLHNVIEDERIECEIARLHPALAPPLVVLRRGLGEPPAEQALHPLALIFLLIRAPARISPALWEQSSELLESVMRVLDPFPASPSEVLAAVRNIILCLPEELRDVDPPPSLLVLAHQRFDGRRTADDPRQHRIGRGLHPQRPDELAPYPAVRWVDAEPRPRSYEELRVTVAAEARRLADRIAMCLPHGRGSARRRGRFDRRRLPAARTDGRLFSQPHAPHGSVALALIVDLSSSMRRGGSARIAQRLAVLLAETIAALPGSLLYAYGHNADVRGEPLTCITRFAAPAHGGTPTLGRLCFGGNNRDAHAIAEIQTDLARRHRGRRGRRMTILISDARPNASGFRGAPAVHETHDAIESLERSWGPAFFLTTEYSPRATSLASGPRIPFSLDSPVDGLARFFEIVLSQLQS
ncbi:MAG: hypothetical protein ACE5FG_08305 [Myxococcota bacterium]